MLSLELLQSENLEEGIRIAEQLKALNDSRKELTEQGTDMADKLIEDKGFESKKVMVIYLPDLHESLAGIVAGRVREKYCKPVFVVTKGENGLKGSARSIPAYHIYEAMNEVKDVFTKFGGHALAAGFSLEESRLEEFDRRINEKCTLEEEDFEEKILIDVPMPMSYVSEELINQLSVLEPFGNGNEKPVFAEKDVELLYCRVMGANGDMGRISARTKDGATVTLLKFRNLSLLLDAIDAKYGAGTGERLTKQKCSGIFMDIIYYPSINEYQGNKTLQFIVNDFK